MKAVFWKDGTVTYKDSKGRVVTINYEKIILNKDEQDENI